MKTLPFESRDVVVSIPSYMTTKKDRVQHMVSSWYPILAYQVKRSDAAESPCSIPSGAFSEVPKQGPINIIVVAISLPDIGHGKGIEKALQLYHQAAHPCQTMQLQAKQPNCMRVANKMSDEHQHRRDESHPQRQREIIWKKPSFLISSSPCLGNDATSRNGPQQCDI